MYIKYPRKFLQSVALLAIVSLLISLTTQVPRVYAAPGDITRVSVSSDGSQGNDGSARPAISADGRFVVFESSSTNLAGGTGGLFLRDRQTGQTTRIVVDGGDASISDDGRFIAFDSMANNIVSGDTNNASDVFVFDRQTATTKRVSVSSSGVEANDQSSFPAISGNGRFVAFNSDATNLITGDTNALKDIFVRDLQTGVTERISIATDGTQANAAAIDESISSDGRMVVFSSAATNLVSGDTNGATDVFARDRQTGITTRVSVNSSGVEANRGGSDSSVSGNGRFVSFSSFSTNLMTQDSWEFMHIYVRDLQTGITTLASANPDGTPLIERSEQSVLSADGRYVAFQFDDKGDGQAIFQVYAIDRQTGVITVAAGGHGGGSWAGSPAISADGRFLAFAADYTTLVPGDTNGVMDVFVRELSFAPDLIPAVVSVQPICGGGGCPLSAPTITFQVTFSEVVSGVTADDFALNLTGGISGAAITGVSGAGSAYVVTVDTGAGDGAIRLDVLDDDSIKDATLNPLGGVGAGNGIFNTGGIYTIHKSIPTVTGILALDPNPVTALAVRFTVNFNEDVTGVDVGDFALASTGPVVGAVIADVGGSGASYTVMVNFSSGHGTLGLDLVDNDSIVDLVGNHLGGDGVGNGSFTGGQAYQVEMDIPSVTSVVRLDMNPTIADVVRFNVTFSEAVSGVDVNDFILRPTDSLSGVSVLSVSGSADTYIVTAGTGSGNGTMRLDVLDDDTIVDSVGNPLGYVGLGNGNFTAGESYAINRIALIPMSVDFRSTGARDGWISEKNENSNTGGTKNTTAPDLKVGDDSSDRQFRAILHFPTYYLPDDAVVTQAILMIRKQRTVGTDPFTTHQNIVIDIRQGIFSSTNVLSYWSMQLTDFQAPADMYTAGTIMNNPVGDWYWAVLDSQALKFISLTDNTQLRIGFVLDDNDDLGEDTIRFFSGDAPNQSDRPHLQIDYYVPRW